MGFVADILMTAGTFGVAVYCFVLAGRLRKFSTLESGMGGAIAVLSAQVDDLTRALARARETANDSAVTLEGLTGRAESVAARLEVLLASMHDMEAPPTRPAEPADFAEPGRRLRFVRRKSARDDLEAAS